MAYTKEKFEQTNMSYPLTRRLLPRHAKGYLWICFLILLFGSMLLSDNGFPLYNMLLEPLGEDMYGEIAPSPVKVNVQVAVSDQLKLAHLPTSIMERPSIDAEAEKPIFGNGSTAFTPDDVVILFKTGATSLWRRVPIHLSTTLGDTSLTPNVVLYSDNENHIAGRPIVDALANMSSTLKATPDFELYHKAQQARESNLYLEAAAIDGDYYLPGAWRLDKYKFLPLVAHAAANHPGKKWYVYMEDDNYFFWNSLFAWLGTFDPAIPLFLGSPAARLGEDFAGGGSGFAISGAAMEMTFGQHPNLASKWESYAQERCCGDQVLSHVMTEMGVPRDRRYDHTGWAGLQTLPTWRMGFGDWNWCSPLFNIHKTHQADVSELHVFERKFQRERGKRAVLRYHDIFTSLIQPTIVSNRTEWDNEASEKWISSGQEDVALLESLTPAQRAKNPWFSASACRQACEEWEMCLSWKYADDNCGLASTAARGRRVDEGIFVVSGWMIDRIQSLSEKKCDALGY